MSLILVKVSSFESNPSVSKTFTMGLSPVSVVAYYSIKVSCSLLGGTTGSETERVSESVRR